MQYEREPRDTDRVRQERFVLGVDPGLASGDRVGKTPAQVLDQVYISVVGADRIPLISRVDRAMFGYFGSKLAAERIVTDSGLPFTMLRATQFHDLILTVAQQMARLPVIPAPSGFRVQPIDADEVAARLVELTLGDPDVRVPDMGGPRVYGAGDLLRGYLWATKSLRG